jgi:hypothetical protein
MAEMPKNAKHLFDELIPQALKQFPDRAKEVGAIYGFTITGDGGGSWLVDLKADPPVCVPGGDLSKSECSIEIAHEDFVQILTNPQMGMQLYFQGKLKVAGDPMLATKLQTVFQMAR